MPKSKPLSQRKSTNKSDINPIVDSNDLVRLHMPNDLRRLTDDINVFIAEPRAILLTGAQDSTPELSALTNPGNTAQIIAVYADSRAVGAAIISAPVEPDKRRVEFTVYTSSRLRQDDQLDTYFIFLVYIVNRLRHLRDTENYQISDYSLSIIDHELKRLTSTH